MSKITEGRLEFNFNNSYTAIKFDDGSFYRKKFNKLPGAKGVDFIAYNSNDFILIEVKDCLGFESENQWRTGTKNNQLGEVPFNTEVAQKVASTFACIVGANTYFDQSSDNASEISGLIDNIKADSHDKRISIYLILEGDFHLQSRNSRMIREEIKKHLKEHLGWIHAPKVDVMDISSANSSNLPFSIKRI